MSFSKLLQGQIHLCRPQTYLSRFIVWPNVKETLESDLLLQLLIKSTDCYWIDCHDGWRNNIPVQLPSVRWRRLAMSPRTEWCAAWDATRTHGHWGWWVGCCFPDTDDSRQIQHFICLVSSGFSVPSYVFHEMVWVLMRTKSGGKYTQCAFNVPRMKELFWFSYFKF